MRAILSRTMLGCLLAVGMAASAIAAPAATDAPVGGVEQRVQQIKDTMSAKPEAALALAQSLERSLAAVPRSTDSAHAMAEALWLEGEARLRLGDAAQAAGKIDAALAIVTQANDRSKLRGDLLLSRGWLAAQRADVAAALGDYQTAYNIFNSLHEARSMALALKQIATLYRSAGDYKTSSKYENESAEVYTNDHLLDMVTYNNMASEFSALKKYKKAQYYLIKSLNLSRSMKSKIQEFVILSNIAHVQIEAGKFRSAESTLALLDKMAARGDSPGDRNQILQLRARLAFQRGQIDRAAQDIARYFTGVDLSKTDLSDHDAHDTAYRSFMHLGKYEGALHHLEALKRLDDRTASLTASANTALMAARFNDANKDAKIANLKADEARRKFEFEQQRGQILWTIFIGVVVAGFFVTGMLIAAALAIRRSRNEVRAANVVLERTNAALEKALAAKTEFLATTSHEIRTPLNGILGMTQVMLADRGLPESARDRLTVVHGAGVTMKALVDDILDVAKMETGNLTLERIPVDLPATLKDVSRLWQEQARAKGVGFVVDTASSPRLIEGDPARLRQIMFNLLSNALKFTTKGEIRLEASLVGENSVRIAVHDTGIGIPADKLGMIFESFRQVDAATTRRFGGTGLGLSICRNLARAMGGDVTVASTLGQGSTFAIELPYHAASVAISDRASTVPEHGGLLVVERNPIARGMMKALFADQVSAISFAPTLEEALVMVRQVAPEIVLIDEATARTSAVITSELPMLIAAASNVGARVAVLWGAISADDAPLLADIASDDIIAKPIAGTELIRRLWHMDQAASAQRAA